MTPERSHQVEPPTVITGRQIGAYRFGQRIGAGGMGEVYAARDSRLGRDVAIKILPPLFTSNRDRLARVEREARMLASLNHPNIGAIYSVEELDGATVLVLELVDGATLAERLMRGALPVTEALTLARQIAEALEAAHEKGIVHRDLKPANVKITPQGVVKLLDFGLATIADGDRAEARAQSPTITVDATRDGLIVGTPAYMSPEQARGQAVDKRADVWAFGCVLYELLTGRQAFSGGTVSDTIAAVLEREPDWTALPSATPDGIRHLLHRCLDKDVRRRLHDIADTHAELDDALAARRPSARSRPLAIGVVAAAVLLVAAGATVFYAAVRRTPAIPASAYVQLTNFTDAAVAPSLSPDGRMVTFKRGVNNAQVGAIGDFLGAGQIYVKLLPDGNSVQLTSGPGTKYAPVFTPDGSRVAYTELLFSGQSVFWDTWTVPVLGGAPTRLLPNASGLTWIDRQHVLFAEISRGLHMGIVTATETRAESRVLYFPALESGMAHYSYASPDLKSVLIVEMANTHAFDSPCRIVPFAGGSIGHQVGPSGTCLSAAWSPDGRWMYFAADVNGGVHLWRQRFPAGTPEQITFGGTQEQGIAVAPDGRSLITSIGSRLSSIWLHDATGERPLTSEGYAMRPKLSADGRRMFYLDSGTSPALGVAGAAPAGELRVVDVASGKNDAVLPGVAISDYDISSDAADVVFTRTDLAGGPQIWLAPINRGSSPRQVARSGDQVSFGANREIFFRLREGTVNYLYRLKPDGQMPERIASTPILIKYGVAPDSEWVIAAMALSRDDARSSDTPLTDTVAVPVRGGAPRKVCTGTCNATWSSDGRFLYVVGAQTYVIPVSPGRSLPDPPGSGGRGYDEADGAPGERVIPHDQMSPGPDPSTYVFGHVELHANLFRIPLQP